MPDLLTLGHSNRDWPAFRALLEAAGVRWLVDVRAFPRSRRHPHFDREAIEAALADTGIGYRWEGRALGGFREAPADSPHLALADGPARGWASHLASADYARAEARLKALASQGPTAVMCAEAQPAHCHRRFIADSLTSQGWTVIHWLAPDEARVHALSPELRIVDGELRYDANSQPGFDF